MKRLRGHVYSNCKENIITEDMCDTISAFPSCSYTYLRLYTDIWMPVSVGEEYFLDVPISESLYVERGNDYLGTVLHVFLALPREHSMSW